MIIAFILCGGDTDISKQYQVKIIQCKKNLAAGFWLYKKVRNPWFLIFKDIGNGDQVTLLGRI